MNVELPKALERDGFCFIPPGRYTIGGDDLAPKSLPEETLEIEGFLMRTHPVTLDEYCTFLNALAQHDFQEAKSRSPSLIDESKYYLDIDEETRRFSVPESDDEGHEWQPDWPAVMIDWYDANRFVEWASDRDGVDYRLPSEIQWEVAARGIDRRIFPWGNGFDPMLCHMVDSVHGRPMPAPIGTYQYDRSPFGVHDMAGLVIEWTRTPSGPGE
ncbi:MAG: formylglycine-generating enzyme family protein [Bradymonadaceae bacterium]